MIDGVPRGYRSTGVLTVSRLKLIDFDESDFDECRSDKLKDTSNE